jgi:hypothetical protein
MRLTGKFTAAVAALAVVLAGLLIAGPATIAAAASTWAAPTPVAGASGLNSVSCPTSSFCMAVDQQGNAFTSDGTTWTEDDPFGTAGQHLTSVSCPSASLCVAVEADVFSDALFWTPGSGWQPPDPLYSYAPNPASLTSVSCMSTTVCLAGDKNGNLYIWNPQNPNWGSTGASFAPTGSGPDPVVSISCAPAFCTALSGSGSYIEYSGGAFTNPASISGGLLSGATAVSCNASMCAAVASQNALAYYSIFDGTTWSSAAAISNPDASGLTSVSCPAAGDCWASDSDGDLAYLQGGTWSASVPIVSAGNTITSISCASADFCVAVAAGPGGVTGEAVEYGTPGTSGGGGPSSGGDVTANATVNQAVSLTGLTGTISFPAANPGSTSTATGAEAYTAFTNDPNGYTLTLAAGGSALTSPSGGSILNTGLSVTESGASPGTQTFGPASGAVLTLAKTSAPSTDSYSENWSLAIPGDAAATTYSESFVYLVLGN